MHVRRVLEEFVGKEVEVFTNKNSFKGVLKFDMTDWIAVVTPSDEWTAKRYGPVTIDGNAIIAIRAVLPRSKNDEDDNCDECAG